MLLPGKRHPSEGTEVVVGGTCVYRAKGGFEGTNKGLGRARSLRQLGWTGQGAKAGESYSQAPQPPLLPTPVCFWCVLLANPNRKWEAGTAITQSTQGSLPGHRAALGTGLEG